MSAKHCWTVRNNGLHHIILEDSGSDLSYVGEFKDEAIARRITDEHNNEREDVKETHAAMLWIGYWLCLGGSRGLIRCRGRYIARDDGVHPSREWNAYKLCELVGLMRGELEGIET